MEEPVFGDSTQTFRTTPKKGRGRLTLAIIIVIFLAIVIFGATKFLGSKGQKKEIVPSPTPTQSQFPTDTPTPEVSGSPTPEITSSPTPKPTVNPVDKATGLDRSNLSVEVQNGSGTVGVASKVSDFLKSFGYHIVAIGNAENYNWENVTIEVKSESSKYLPLLKKDLSESYTVGSTSENLSASSSADALVIVGK